MFKNSFQIYQIGLEKCKNEDEKKPFVFQLEEIRKIRDQLKNELLKNMTKVSFGDKDKKIELEITENGQKIKEDVKIINEIQTEKTYEDLFHPIFHEKYCYDFLKLKNVDGKVLSSSLELKNKDNDKENEIGFENKRVKFLDMENNDKLMTKSSASKKGILKIKRSNFEKTSQFEIGSKNVNTKIESFEELD